MRPATSRFVFCMSQEREKGVPDDAPGTDKASSAAMQAVPHHVSERSARCAPWGRVLAEPVSEMRTAGGGFHRAGQLGGAGGRRSRGARGARPGGIVEGPLAKA